MTIALAVAGLLFLCLYGPFCVFMGLWAYRKGLQDRMTIDKGQPLKPIKSPLQVIDQRKEAKAAKDEPDSYIDSLLKGHANMMAFTGELPDEKR